MNMLHIVAVAAACVCAFAAHARITEINVQRAEPFANSASEDGLSEELAGWSWGIWFSPAVTLGIGTTEIMKNVIAERMLEMPREDDPDVRKPWNETQQKRVAS